MAAAVSIRRGKINNMAWRQQKSGSNGSSGRRQRHPWPRQAWRSRSGVKSSGGSRRDEIMRKRHHGGGEKVSGGGMAK